MEKILFVSTLEIVPSGGSEQLWSDMALRMLSKGYRVMTNTINWENTPKHITDIEAVGGDISFRPNIHFGTSIIDKAKHKADDLKWKKQVEKFDPDIIFISQGGTMDDAVKRHGDWFKTLNKPIYILSQFMEEYDYQPQSTITYFTDFFNNAKQVWFVSQRNKERAEVMMANKIKNAVIVKNPIKLNSTTECYPATGVYNFAVVSRLDAIVKGYDILLHAFSQPQWKERNFLLNIYGSGKDEAYIKKLISFFDLDDKVVLKGFTNDVVDIWTNNHIMLMASRSEGTPLSLLEASYCKRAAVVTDVGGNTDIITEGKNGFVADAPTIKSFSDAAERAWAKKDEWEQLGKNAKEHISELYSTDPIEDAISLLVG